MDSVAIVAKRSVNGFLHLPAEPAGHGLVLTHGAGGNCQSKLLIEIARAFAEAGWFVLRCNLPFRQRRPYGPPMPAGAHEDRAALKDAAQELRSMVSGRICLGGHSYGGRQASILLSEEPQIADGLLLFSYPLHPPKKPQDLRTSHFPRLQTPALFVQGTRDPFASIEEMRAALPLIPASTELIAIENGGHDLFKGDLLKGSFNMAQLVVGPFQRMLGI